jgi:hypothetical protein
VAADPVTCRKHAMASMRLAQTARTPELHAALVSMAETWTKLAAEAELYEALLLVHSMEEPAPAAGEDPLTFRYG